MNYEEYRSTSKWTKGFWDPELAPLSNKQPVCNMLLDSDVYDNYIQDPNRTYIFDFFESDDKIINPYWKDKIVNYTLNSHGYRGPSFNSSKKIKIITIGCSHVFGTGIDDGSTWAEQLKQLIKQYDTDDVEVFNLGTPGASSDLNTVQLYQLINIIKPNIVFWMPPEWRRYDLGSKSLDTLSLASFIDLDNTEVEHSTQTIQPGENFEKFFSKNVVTYVRTGNLDIQTRYQNFCRNFTIVKDLCEYNNIIFYSFTNFHQVRGLYNHLIRAYTEKLPVRETMKFLKFVESYDYILKEQAHFDEISREEAALDYYIAKTQKNIIRYNSKNLILAMLKIRKDAINRIYDEYIDGIDSDPMHPKILARDNAHNGHFFNTFLARISYDIVKEDIAKLLNTT